MSVRTPKYRLHKGSGQALVRLDGRVPVGPQQRVARIGIDVLRCVARRLGTVYQGRAYQCACCNQTNSIACHQRAPPLSVCNDGSFLYPVVLRLSQAVRHYRMEVLREIITGFDFDGVELDFMRSNH